MGGANVALPGSSLACGVDGSELSIAAAQTTGRLAERVGVPLVLVNVESASDDKALDGETVAAAVVEAAPGVELREERSRGPVAEELVAACARHGAGLIAVGSRGRGALKSALLGSVTAGLLRVAGVPPAAGFVGKLELFRAAAGSPALIALFFVGSALSFVYAFQIYQHDSWRGPRRGTPSAASEQVVVAALALLVLAVGIWPEPLLALSHDAAEALTGGAP